jgi:hypothetical protein
MSGDASGSYDPAAVPEWAREAIARTAREHPEHLAGRLDHVAAIEAARQHGTKRPTALPDDPRDILHLAAIRAWQALASGKPAPVLDPQGLEEAISEAFTAGNGISPVDQMCSDWLEMADRCGIPVHDAHGDLRPEVDEAITRTVTAAIWFGITTGYLTLTRGRYRVPRNLAGYP